VELLKWKALFGNGCRALFTLAVAIAIVVGVYLVWLLNEDRATDYADPVEHFKYGSTGGERESGFPLWIWKALPQVCAEHLPDRGFKSPGVRYEDGKGYAAFGMIYEKGKELPVGTSLRSVMGIERTFLNCAVCHTSTVRETPQGEPSVHPGMPANAFNVMAFEKFFFDCGADPKFSAEFIVPEVGRLKKAQRGRLGLIDRYIVYPVAIWIMRDRLTMLRGRFQWVYSQHEWGPGRVDTFNAAKVLFNIPVAQLPDQEKNAPADFPSVWNQEKKRGMHLHWDGNNNMVEERNKSAAFGTGTTPPTIDLERIGRVEAYLSSATPPPYPYAIDAALADKGAAIYTKYCSACHGESGQVFGAAEGDRKPECLKPGEPDAPLYGPQVGKITRIELIGTDRRRLDSYTRTLAVNQGTVYAGYDWRFCHFRKTFGYANMPLDGLWLRAPYLHNGSVPTLRDLLDPAAARPKVFYRGYDVYDPKKVGFVATVAEEGGRKHFRYDTGLPGNSNRGHEGAAYGTQLAPGDKDALVEYLKKF
jgi:hypothetical protein